MKKFHQVNIREKLRSSYWFIPTLMTGIAIALAFVTHMLDVASESGAIKRLDWAWFYTGGPEGALTLLSTVAQSMITVAVTAFSVTLVALSLASQQFGPRVLRNFMQDMSYQVVLGTFIATFIYCLLVLRTVSSDQNQSFVPYISLTVAIVLALASIGMLIYFIHHAATSIHAWHIIGKISAELNNSINILLLEKVGQQKWDLQSTIEEVPEGFDYEAYPILAAQSGYIQAINEDQLMKIAKSNDLLLGIKKRPGKFVIQGTELVKLWPRERVNMKTRHGASLYKQINNAFILGGERTARQDVEFPIRQLVEIAIRAISPAVNDPFTALRCIDQLCAALCRLAERDFPPSYHYDDQHNLRIILNQVTFAGLVDDAFHQIRQYGRSDAAITIRLLEVIAVIGQHTNNDSKRAVLLRHADMIQRGSQQGLPEELDRKDVEARYQIVTKILTRPTMH